MRQTLSPGDDPSSASPPSRSDQGATLVEMLIAIVLIGGVVGAVLMATSATIIGGRIERDHAKAQQWLQAAIGVIEAIDFQSCDPNDIDGAKVRDIYQQALIVGYADTNGDGQVNGADGARRPWEYDGAITVDVPEVWNGDSFVPFDSQSTCYDQSRLRQQRVRIRVTHPSGIDETVELIKVDR